MTSTPLSKDDEFLGDEDLQIILARAHDAHDFLGTNEVVIIRMHAELELKSLSGRGHVDELSSHTTSGANIRRAISLTIKTAPRRKCGRDNQ
jgi:hypothetical protein